MGQFDYLFDVLMDLCARVDSFYWSDQYDQYGSQYRIFAYRLGTFSDFQNHFADECRGHTFRRTQNNEWVLASLPQHKFWNYGEHVGWKTKFDYSQIDMIMDKLDGSLISTVIDHTGGWFLKSKTSFKSAHVVEATAYMQRNAELAEACAKAVSDGYTVNMELTSPDLRIVIGYPETKLTVLNARHMQTGTYMHYADLVARFGRDNVVQTFPVPDDGLEFFKNAEKMTGIEGFVVVFKNGVWVKHKTEAYAILHHLKDAVNNPRRLWEACVFETADDLRGMFKDDQIVVKAINEMEEKASKTYNFVHRTVHDFYNKNKHLPRKDYAINALEALPKYKMFHLAMNLYKGLELDLKTHLVAHYKMFGIRDEEKEE